MSIFGEKKAVREVQEDLWKLRNQVDQLESQVKISKLEATEVYDKTMRLMHRMAKRYVVDQKENGELVEVTEPDDGLDPISRSIMLRRGMQGIRK